MRRRSDRLQTTASRRRCSRPTSPGRRAICASATARAVPSRGAPVSVSRRTRNTGYRPTSRFMWSTVTARWRLSNSPLSQAIRLDLPAPSSPEKVISMPGSPREAVLTQPQLEREQGEDPLAEAAPAHPSAGAAPAVAERSEPAVHERTVQHGARAGIPGKQEVVQGAVEIARHHHVERNAESLFGAPGDGSREPTTPQGPQHALADTSPGLESVGQRDPERDDFFVEHGHPHLDAGPHAHHVHFAQHVGWQADAEATLGEAPGQFFQIRGTPGPRGFEMAVHGREPGTPLRPHELFFLRLAQGVCGSHQGDRRGWPSPPGGPGRPWPPTAPIPPPPPWPG